MAGGDSVTAAGPDVERPGVERPGVERRTVLAGAMGLAAVAGLAACGSSSSGGATAAGSAPTTSAGTTPATTPDDKGGGGSGGALVELSAVPVGGAVSAKGADGKALVVSQPTAGQVACFSAKCTHRGCTVAPAGKTFQCPCHGSVFDAATGKNVSGPAPSPLTQVPVKVVDGKVVLA